MHEIEIRLREILISIVSDDEEKVQIINSKDKVNLVEDLEFDSVMILEYIVRVEDEFDITLEEEEDMVDIIWDYEKLLTCLAKKAENK